MTYEVIDLLSSGPPDRPSSLSPTPHRPTEPETAASESAPRPFRDGDVFDLNSDPPVSFQAPQGDAASQDPSPRAAPPPKRAVSPTPFYDLDDFDTTGDLDANASQDEPLRHIAQNGKRLRLSPPGDVPSKLTSSSESYRSNAKVGHWPPIRPSGGTLNKTRAMTDVIEFSSSPCVAPSNVKSSKRPTSHADDPFHSTSPLPCFEDEAPSGNKNHRPDLDDPFASTPPLPPPAGGPIPSRKVYIDLETSEEDDVPVRRVADSSGFTRQKGKLAEICPNSQSTFQSRSPKRTKNILDWDPISSSAPESQNRDPFASSSPPRPSKSRGKAPAVVIDLDDSDDSNPGRPRTSASSDDELPDLDAIDVAKYRHRLPPPPPSRSSRSFSRTNSAPVSWTSAQADASRSRTKKSSDERALDKESKAAEREREKERKKREREAAREQKARDKERAAAIAQVNKVRTDKKISTPEMIVDLPPTLPDALALQVKTLLKELNVESTTCQQSPVENVITFRRKVKSTFNENLGLWEPCALRIEEEKHALVVLTADEFVAMVLGSDGADLETHVSNVKRHFSHHQLVYLIEGLGPWMRKNRNLRNRQFVSAVRAQDTFGSNSNNNNNNIQEDEGGGGTRGRRRKNPGPPPPRKEYIDEDTIEDALLQLQVLHGVLIHHTSAGVETAQWVAVFTQHISTVPYRKLREAANADGAGFCMETGQVRTGEDARATYAKLLQEIVRVTAAIAYGIVAEYSSVGRLVKGLEDRGPLALEACPRSDNREGAPSDRAIGPAISRRIYKVFTGRDETSTDI